ncbi:MAG: hypothetical protein ACI4S2_13100 [Lachnospiraceae bacterium]
MKRIDRVFKFITIVCITIYSIVMGYLFSLTNARVPDEIWFYGIIDELQISSPREFFLMENYLGYGSIYWMILYVLHTFSNIRIFCWISLMSMPITLIFLLRRGLGRNWTEVFSALFLYLSSPLNWFTGKIIGPEIIGNAFGCLGLFLLMMGFFLSQEGILNYTKANICLILGGGNLGIACGDQL